MAYGGRGREWHPKFIQYMESIVQHPEYAGMPCVYTADGTGYDWTIPSFRAEGSNNWDGNQKRREWWRVKADELGIEQSGKWISKVAKAIHPGKKPCQVCGREMFIAYCYPQARTIRRLNTGLPRDDQLHHQDLLTVWEAIEHVREALPTDHEAATLLVDAIPKLKDHLGKSPSVLGILQVVSDELVPNEYRGFSPGAMANPPDRLDGFHTYNLCCRSKQDTGRSKENLSSYGVDRRAFEQWADGDWGVANRLMSEIGQRTGLCAHSGTTCSSRGPTVLTADHIGPISLGFKHAGAFALLCRTCNSAKNNRMSAQDVEWLIQLEQDDSWSAASWHARDLWLQLRDRIRSTEDALLLSKALRTNQHLYLTALSALVEAGVGGTLVDLLNLEPAETRVKIRQSALKQLDGARIVRLTTTDYTKAPRQRSYAESLKGRLIRIAFESLAGYGSKARRKVRLDEAAAVGGLDLEASLRQLVRRTPSASDDELSAFDDDLEIHNVDRRESAFRAWVADGRLAGLKSQDVVAELNDFQARIAEALVQVFDERRPPESKVE